MTIPSFAAADVPTKAPQTLTRPQAARRLGVHVAAIDKLIASGVLCVPISSAALIEIAARPLLQVVDGELTVLRTNSRTEVSQPGGDRRWIGFHVDHSDPQLDETSLAWWRSEPDRVVSNELLAVCVAAVPVAVYRITGHEDEIRLPDEDTPRHRYAGQLLARLRGGGMHADIRQNTPGHLRARAQQIMDSRVLVKSGGPIGYLGRLETDGRYPAVAPAVANLVPSSPVSGAMSPT